jgi:hypothetical protein
MIGLEHATTVPHVLTALSTLPRNRNRPPRQLRRNS